MKFYYFLPVLIASPLFAQRAAPDLTTVTNLLSREVNPQVDNCSPATYCPDLSRSICDQPVPGNTLDTLIERHQPPQNNTGPKVPRAATPASETIRTINQVENELFTNSPVRREDLDNLFNETRTSMINLISTQTSIPEAVRGRMTVALANANFMMGQRYLDERIASLQASNPTISRDEIVDSALGEYNEFCAPVGLDANAFRRGVRIVFCPGLIHKIIDAGARTKEQILNALSFTMAHELGHYISETTYPGVYRNLATCYNQVSGRRNYWRGRGEETGADFWGIQVLNSRLRAQGVTDADAFRSLHQATIGFCEMEESEDYMSGRDRLRFTMERNPDTRTLLGCPETTSQAPACNLSGQFPQPSSR